MSRDILFRAKRIANDEWIEGYYVKFYSNGECEPNYMIFAINEEEKSSQPYSVDSETVCQYTGLTDKNGRKIFEGDIVKSGGKLVVKWNDKYAGWCITKEGWLYNHFFGEACDPKDCEVIGNIFDNPKLLNRGRNDD